MDFPFITDIALPGALTQTFSYGAESLLTTGVRVRVSFGQGLRQVIGIVIKTISSKGVPEPEFTLKPILEVLDETPLLTEQMLELAHWLSRYYHYPLGEVLRFMLAPAAGMKEPSYISTFRVIAEEWGKYEKIRHLFPTDKEISRRTINTCIKKASLLVRGKQETLLRRLIEAACLEEIRKYRQAAEWQEAGSCDKNTVTQALKLTPDQSKILEVLQEQLPPKATRPCLLWGVTGAGKTEIYLQLIASMLATDSSRQALLLVPEIALTPQTYRALNMRFPEQVALLHSNQSETDRKAEWERARSGAAKILLGPRSAILTPMQNLALIIVDEEHDGSYKQSTYFTYNGRDVAVLRANYEKALVVLGSATPSMESLNNTKQGRYQLLHLDKRVHGRGLPPVEIHEVSADKGGTYVPPHCTELHSSSPYIAPPIHQALQDNYKQGGQSIVLVNRRGYAHYLYDRYSKQVLQCLNCSVSLTLHKEILELNCHYCGLTMSLRKAYENNPGAKFYAIGSGSESIETTLKELLPNVNIARLDADVAKKKSKLLDTLEQFRTGEIDILVGTQMLAKGHDFPNTTLSVLIDADQSLSLPDFRAGERTFQLMVQAAGRTGRGQKPGKVLLQSLSAEHPLLQSAKNHDYREFSTNELYFRQQYGYPPFTRMIAWEYSATDLKKLEAYCKKLSNTIKRIVVKNREFGRVKILGPNQPALSKINRRHRRILLASSATTSSLHHFAEILKREQPRPFLNLHVIIDVDPQSLL